MLENRRKMRKTHNYKEKITQENNDTRKIEGKIPKEENNASKILQNYRPISLLSQVLLELSRKDYPTK